MKELWNQFKPLVFVGWAIALIRLIWDSFETPTSMYFGVYYAMPVVFVVFSLRGMYHQVRWLRLAAGMLLVGVLVWGLGNAISYSTAQFMEWSHGRFSYPDRGPEIAETAMGKLITGLQIGAVTGLVGGLYCILWSTLIFWLPGFLKRRGQPAEETAIEIGPSPDSEEAG